MFTFIPRTNYLHEACAGELCEPVAVDVHRQRAEASNQNVQPEVELLAADKVRVRDVPLHHVRTRIGGVVPLRTTIRGAQ